MELLLLCANCDEFVFENVLHIRLWYNGNKAENKPVIPLTKTLSLAIQRKLPERHTVPYPPQVVLYNLVQYNLAVLFIILYKVVLTFEAQDQKPKCDHTNESY